MIPKSLSASSLQTWTCPARWRDEWFLKAPMLSGSAADKGTACHAALEWYVKNDLWKTGHGSTGNRAMLQTQLSIEYRRLFGDDMSGFGDCTEMVMRWYDRTDFTGRTVLSAEVKNTFPVKTSVGDIPFNYLWDRCDQLDDPNGELVIEVIDYKTLIKPLRADGLKDKIQARCYGLAAQIMYPKAKRIWVTFDMLRYDPVGIAFTRDENIATWKFIKAKAEEMIGTEPDEAPEVLNVDCRWCIRKVICPALRQHALAGGVLALDDPLAAAQQRAELDYASAGLNAAIRELDDFLIAHAESQDETTFTAGDLDVIVDVGRRRHVDMSRALKIVPADVLARYGSLTMKAIDGLLKGSDLTADQKRQLRSLIEFKYGEPRVKTERRNPID